MFPIRSEGWRSILRLRIVARIWVGLHEVGAGNDRGALNGGGEREETDTSENRTETSEEVNVGAVRGVVAQGGEAHVSKSWLFVSSKRSKKSLSN
ncbi:hypothetical protein N8152_02505 [bacterium]|nr:hypothetical protein [bacterium]